MQPYFSFNPHPDLPVISDGYLPLYGDKIIGYMIYEPSSSCLTTPKPSRLNIFGWLSCFLLGFFCFPCCFVPCFFSSFYDGYQIALYKYPTI